ncbi:MAG: NUDIX hydrolase [Anaerolineae bacterium]|nr:NUDIX hydrolase [Anaerolineae bacterium]
MQENVLDTRRVYDGRLFNLDVCDVRLPDGSIVAREVVRHPGATALIALDDQENILLVRQFRIASGQVMSEIPAGTREGDEPPEICAVRELREETGYRPGKLHALGGFYVAPGYTTEYIYLFLATELVEDRLTGDSDEFIEVTRVTLDEALSMIERGEISDAKTIIGVLRYARHKAAGNAAAL